ncbi:MAG: 2,3-bisphosphoglycerate-independent phosphoglycerate mutase, partial [Candidatus Liptonbacteria bacterium]|nr:2,3-bisphosphoglycerate-independent phosphoglycerate mutase [Candidatus Liptonbacteria bacterium]
SGIAVGLPWGEEGNSEVGHLTIGAGKILYQHFLRIMFSIQNGEFFKNPVLKEAFSHAKTNRSAVHLVGLLTEGNVHSSLEHIRALLTMAEREGVPDTILHVIADGEDSKPQSVLGLIGQLPAGVKIGTIAGRFYAMDRDAHWERTRAAYMALTGDPSAQTQGPQPADIAARIRQAYGKQPNDRFIEPFIVDPNRTIKDDDAIVFFNFREDRMRQIVQPFIEPAFSSFPVNPLKNLSVCTFTKYADAFRAPVVFEQEHITVTLGATLAAVEKTQLRIAETEKYPHITYFFNGYRETPDKNEYRVLIPSFATPHPEEHPEMRAKEIADRAIQAIQENSFDFILLNFANPDIVGHSGDFAAARRAIAVIDEQIGRIGSAVIEADGIFMITADHGNVEAMVEAESGIPQTRHDPNPVPVYLIGREYYAEKTAEQAEEAEQTQIGVLADVAPTILQILGIPKPPVMTGESFLHTLS